MAIAKRKKRFFEVEMPIIGKETQLIAFEVEELEGKFIKYDLTRILKGKSILLDSEVSVKDGKATSTPRKISIVPYYVKRIIRKGTDYVEDSFELDCKDAVLIIKPILVTRRKVSKALRRALRNKVNQELKEYAKNLTYEELFTDILRNKLQKEISLKAKKIYPLSAFEIRALQVKKVLESAPKEEPKAEKKKDEETEEKTE